MLVYSSFRYRSRHTQRTGLGLGKELVMEVLSARRAATWLTRRLAAQMWVPLGSVLVVRDAWGVIPGLADVGRALERRALSPRHSTTDKWCIAHAPGLSVPTGIACRNALVLGGIGLRRCSGGDCHF